MKKRCRETGIFVLMAVDKHKLLACYNTFRMKVILKTHVKDLGSQGEVVNVSDGHALHHLLPRGLAIPATNKAIVDLEHRRVVVAYRQQKEKKATSKLLGQLQGYHLTLAEPVSSNGTLYGAVTSRIIAEALQKVGYEIEASMIDLPHPIKTPGEQFVQLHLPHGFEASIHLTINSQ